MTTDRGPPESNAVEPTEGVATAAMMPPPPHGEKPNWFIEGPYSIGEEVDPPFTFGVSQLLLEPGQSRSIDIRVDFLAIQAGHGAASFADFVGGEAFLFLAIQAAAAKETGIAVQDLGHGVVRVTFAANASTNQISFDVLAVEDGIDEPVEDFRFVLENEIVTAGAVPSTIVPGEGTSFIDSQVLDPDAYRLTISDAGGFEGDQLVFDITMSNDCQTPPPEWFIVGPPCLLEEVDAPYTLGISDLQLAAGQTRSVDVRVEFLPFHDGHDAANFADLAVPNFLFDALSDAAARETGITVAHLGNGAVRVTFAANASTTQLEFDIAPSSGSIDEGVEDFRFVLENSAGTNGAQPAAIVPGEGTSYVESHIVESDEYSVVCGCEGGENTPPHANNDHASTACGLPVTIAVLDNDGDADGDALQVEAFTSAFNGTLVNNGDGTFTYAPFADFTGIDSFSYAVSDGNGGIDSAVVRIRVEEGEVCDCDIPPPPVCGRSSADERNADTQAALAAPMGLPLAEQIGDQGEQSQERGRNGQQNGHDGERRGGGGRDEGDHDGGRGSENDSGDSDWRWSHWDGDPGGDRTGDNGDRAAEHASRNGAGDDVLVAKSGSAEIHGDAGFDTFKFDDSGVLDLSLLAGKVMGIEQADISGIGNVELKLTFQDLLVMTDNGHQLTILGDSGDKVSADFTGHSVAASDMGSFTRYVIDGGAATLDIDNNVQKNIIGI